MIGNKLKGIRHLFRVVMPLGEADVVFKHNNGLYFGFGTIVYVPGDVPSPYKGDGNGYMLLFSNAIKTVSVNPEQFSETPCAAAITRLVGKYGNAAYIITRKKGSIEEAGYNLLDIHLLPESFRKDYDDFCNSNKKQMNECVSKYFGTADHDGAKYIYALTNGSKNFFFWAATAMYKFGQPHNYIEKIMSWDQNYGKMANKLKKGTITAYTGKESLFRLMREMYLLRRDKRANDVIKTFNTAQRKALSEKELTDRDYETLSRFSKLSFKKKSNFIKKMSSVDDVNEVLRQMAFLADIHFDWNKNSFVDYLKNNENLSCEVVLDRDNIMVLKVNDYETIKRLTKATNWCISKDKKYWNDYVENRKNSDQYVIFDFSRKEDDNLSIVGFTCDMRKGITNSHDFNNKNLMNGKRRSVVDEIKSFASKAVDMNSIFSVLEKHNIDVSMFMPTPKTKYEWSRKGVISYLERCVSSDDYYFICDNGDKFAFICESSSIMYFLGEKFIDNYGNMESFEGREYIVFVDLTKDEKDATRILYGIITHDFVKNESSCNRIYNINCDVISKSFNKVICEYGLPYDIICRNDNIIERFFNAFCHAELTECRALIKNEKVIAWLKEMPRSENIYDTIRSVTFNYHTMDYINLFYDAGIRLSDVIEQHHLENLLNDIYNHIYINGSSCMKKLTMPTKEDVLELDNQKSRMIPSKADYIGFTTMLMKIIETERTMFTAIYVASMCNNRFCNHDIGECIMARLVEQQDFDNVSPVFVSYADNFCEKAKSSLIRTLLANKSSKNKDVEELLKKYRKRKVECTEMWVKSDDFIFSKVNVSEPVVAH